MSIKIVFTTGKVPAEGLEIRRKVFVEEQGVPPEAEYDELDGSSCHVLASVDGAAAGYGRVVFEEAGVRFTRIAVLRCRRGLGVGRTVVLAMLRCARKEYAKCVYLHSQLDAVGFYKKLGFSEYGEIFYEAGIPHISMKFTEDNTGVNTH